jgi:hypothetical protein
MAPARGICGEKLRLRQEFVDAITELQGLQTLHSQSLANSIGDAFLEKSLHVARMKRYHARNALLAHVRDHGCKE